MTTTVSTGLDGSLTTGLVQNGRWQFLPLNDGTSTGLHAHNRVLISPPNYPVWSVQQPGQAPNQIKGISAPPGFQGTPPAIDPAVDALQSVALTKGLI